MFYIDLKMLHARAHPRTGYPDSGFRSGLLSVHVCHVTATDRMRRRLGLLHFARLLKSPHALRSPQVGFAGSRCSKLGEREIQVDTLKDAEKMMAV